jgi:hypothetical protein
LAGADNVTICHNKVTVNFGSQEWSDDIMANKVGRPRLYADDAEKQKAYRLKTLTEAQKKLMVYMLNRTGTAGMYIARRSAVCLIRLGMVVEVKPSYFSYYLLTEEGRKVATYLAFCEIDNVTPTASCETE